VTIGRGPVSNVVNSYLVATSKCWNPWSGACQASISLRLFHSFLSFALATSITHADSFIFRRLHDSGLRPKGGSPVGDLNAPAVRRGKTLHGGGKKHCLRTDALIFQRVGEEMNT
jgi:hypothetical protein